MAHMITDKFDANQVDTSPGPRDPEEIIEVGATSLGCFVMMKDHCFSAFSTNIQIITNIPMQSPTPFNTHSLAFSLR